MDENKDLFGALGDDSPSSSAEKRVTHSSIGRVSRRDFLKIAGAAAATFVTGGVIKTVIDFAPKDTSLANPLSDQYQKLMGRQDVKDALNKFGITQTGEGTEEETKAFLYNYTSTKAYLEDSVNENWQNSIADLEKGGDAAFYGQMTALSTPTLTNPAGCLASNKTISYNPATNVSSCDFYQGFKKMSTEMKAKYIKTFNAKAEKLIKP